MRHKVELFGIFIITGFFFGYGIYWFESLDKIKIMPSVSAQELIERIRKYQFYGTWVDSSGLIKKSFPYMNSAKGRAWLDIQHANSYGGILFGKQVISGPSE